MSAEREAEDGGVPSALAGVRVLLAILSLPAVVTLVVPVLVLGWSGAPLPPPLGPWPLRLAGGALIAAGLGLAAWTVSLFAHVGHGTLAPWDPPRRLVVRGPYRHMRNPMITAVVAILLGEAALFASPALLAWAVVFALVNAVYIPLLEEPALARRFGADYEAYCRHVPRWLPRGTAWQPPAA
jgi:protein-S-isoprenylcysteine O-methyltransferase Ste14